MDHLVESYQSTPKGVSKRFSRNIRVNSMPTYEYQCLICGNVRKATQSIHDQHLPDGFCSSCKKITIHKRLIGMGLTLLVKTDVMTAVRKARKKHGFPENRGPQQDAVDKYVFERKAGTGQYRKKKPKGKRTRN